MATVPPNLTLIREDFQKSRSLSQIKASMVAATTDYVMVLGKNDILDVTGPLTGEVCYLPTSMATRRSFRYAKPVLPYDPLLLLQSNYIGLPILHRSLVPLFPETSVEPWHTVMVRAQSLGASFGLVEGTHTIIDPWPRPELTGAYSPFRFSLDPDAVMAVVPSLLVQEINQQPVYTLRDTRQEATRAFCHNCSTAFVAGLAAMTETVTGFDFNQIRASQSEFVAWFDSIDEAASDKLLSQLRIALEFPGVTVVSPLVVPDFTIGSYSRSAFTSMGIARGFSFDAWMARTSSLNEAPPTSGCINNRAILRKIA